MKKIFSKFDKNEKLDLHHYHQHHHHHNASVKETNSFIGKTFTIGRNIVVVEDVLAEGKKKTKQNEMQTIIFSYFEI